MNGDEEKKPDTGKTSAELLAHMLVKAKQGLHYNVSVLDWEEYHTVQKCETENEYDIWFFPVMDETGKRYGATNIFTDTSIRMRPS